MRGLGPRGTVDRVRHTLGQEPLAAVPVIDVDARRDARRFAVLRGVMLGASFILSVFLGPGWIALAVLAVVHYLLFGVRTALVGVVDGLAVVRASGLKVELVGRWPVGAPVTVTLTPGEPDARLRLPSWTGHVHGTDLDELEATVRQGGGEVLRIVERD